MHYLLGTREKPPLDLVTKIVKVFPILNKMLPPESFGKFFVLFFAVYKVLPFKLQN